MKCPHCLENFHGEPGRGQGANSTPMGHDQWKLKWTFCPACEKPVVAIQWMQGNVLPQRVIYPHSAGRAALPSTVPEQIAQDFREAVEVLPASAKASAALSRRLLQQLLREYGGYKGRNLETEIEQAMPNLPAYLSNALDAVRHVGNFAAHPIKSGSTGEVVDVQSGEAEWLVETVEALIDFYIVKPAALDGRRTALNEKLADAGKPELKTADEPPTATLE
jgi:hypothetical protein